LGTNWLVLVQFVELCVKKIDSDFTMCISIIHELFTRLQQSKSNINYSGTLCKSHELNVLTRSAQAHHRSPLCTAPLPHDTAPPPLCEAAQSLMSHTPQKMLRRHCSRPRLCHIRLAAEHHCFCVSLQVTCPAVDTEVSVNANRVRQLQYRQMQQDILGNESYYSSNSNLSFI